MHVGLIFLICKCMLYNYTKIILFIEINWFNYSVALI